MNRFEPTEKEIVAVRKWTATLKTPLTTDEIRKLENERFARLAEQRAAADAATPTPIMDRMAAAQKTYDESMRLLAEKTSAPPTEKDLQDAENIAEMRIEQRRRYDEARAESLLRARGLPTEKF
jgi:uncharacterized protein involved in type VI secretion and phage assembly